MKFFKIYIPTPLGILIIVIEVFIAVLIMNFMVNDMQKELMPEMDNIKTIISHQTTNANVNQAVDTADWQSYENKGYKYKIKYPEIGSIKEAFTYGKNESEVSPRVSDIQIVIGEAGSENMILQVYPIDTNLDEHIYDLTPDKDVINRGTETIDGLVMKSLVINGYLTRKSDDIIHESIKLYPRNKVLFIEKDNYVYRFILGKIIEPNLSLKKNDLRIMNQIVATFQFTDETAGWKTYINTKYGYSVKYSQDGSFNELTSGIEGENDKGYIVDFNIKGLSIRITSDKNSREDKTLEQLIEVRNNVGVPLYVDNASDYQTINIGGQQAFKYLNYLNGDKKSTRIGANTLLLKDKYYYQITTGNQYAPEFTADKENIYDAFVGTFQFTAPDTSDWQTYRNEEWGYSVNYPKGWTYDDNTGVCSQRSVAFGEQPVCGLDFPTSSFGIVVHTGISVNQILKDLQTMDQYASEEININGIDTIKILGYHPESDLGARTFEERYIFIVPGKLISFSYETVVTKEKNLLDTFETMATTFMLI